MCWCIHANPYWEARTCAYMCVGSRAAARSNGDSPSLIPSHRNSPSSSPTAARHSFYPSVSLFLSFTHSFSSSFSLVPPRRCFILLAPPCASSTNALLYSSSLLLANGLFVIRLSLSLFGGSVDRFSSLSFCFLFFFLLLLSPILRSFFGYRRFPLYSIILFPLITRQTKIYNCF